MELSPMISQRIYQSGYGRFRPNKCGCHLWRWCYRGCWHQSFPPLIRQDIYSWQKPMQYISTWDPLITLSCIVKVSRLLHPVGLGSVSQYPSPGYLSQGRTDLRLGEPLPLQQPNQPPTHPWTLRFRENAFQRKSPIQS